MHLQMKCGRREGDWNSTVKIEGVSKGWRKTLRRVRLFERAGRNREREESQIEEEAVTGEEKKREKKKESPRVSLFSARADRSLRDLLREIEKSLKFAHLPGHYFPLFAILYTLRIFVSPSDLALQFSHFNDGCAYIYSRRKMKSSFSPTRNGLLLLFLTHFRLLLDGEFSWDNKSLAFYYRRKKDVRKVLIYTFM